MRTCAALVVAAGRGHRYGAEIPKQYLDLNGEPVLRRTVRAFLDHPRLTAVHVVYHPDDRDLYDEATRGLGLPEPIPGGAERQDSVRAGLEHLAADRPDLVLIHDAARPFVASDVIDRVIDALADTPGAIAAVPVNDTLKRARDGHAVETVDRSFLWRAQTPQGFRFPEILEAHRAAAGRAMTDDANVAEAAGLEVALVLGSEENVKVTTLEDLERAERRFVSAAWEYRTGCGYDTHRFEAGDSVMLCGVAIPHDQGLKGHSDADVGLHALTDAVLASIGAGDIGDHFPPGDARWRQAPSDIFLGHAALLLADRGGRIANVDVTLICERPKVAPHRHTMVHRVADILGVTADRVSIKATTTEGLGFTGRGEGIAAHAVATVCLPAPGHDD